MRISHTFDESWQLLELTDDASDFTFPVPEGELASN